MIGSRITRRGLWLFVVSLFALGCVPSPGKLPGGDSQGDVVGDVLADLGQDGQTQSDIESISDLSLDTLEPRPDSQSDGATNDLEGDVTSPTDSFDAAPIDAVDATADLVLADQALPDQQETTEPPAPDYPEGILGAPPGGTFRVIGSVEIKNDSTLARTREVAFSGIPLAKEDDVREVDRLVLVDNEGRWIRAQFDVLARWGGALGNPADNARAIRWLEISLPTSIEASTTKTYELREYTTPAVTSSDPYTVSIIKLGNVYRVSTGVARFTLNPFNPALIEKIEVDFAQTGTFTTIYTHVAGAGPRMTSGSGSVIETLASYDAVATDNTVSVDASPTDAVAPDFEIVERGPVKVVVRVRGHFRRPQERRDCTDNNFDDPTDPFGFSAALTFFRGSADVGLHFNFRNECGRADPDDLTLGGTDVQEVSWQLPLPTAAKRLYYRGFSTTHTTVDDFQGEIWVAQSKGRTNTTSSKWESDAFISLQPNGEGVTFPERQGALLTPWIVAESDVVQIGITMPWMRWREPQGLFGRHDKLALSFVSEPLFVGEATGIWNVARIHIAPTTSTIPLATRMQEQLLRTNRGLLVRSPLAQLNRTRVFPSLGRDALTASKLKQNYIYALTNVHGYMLGYPVATNPAEPGQWVRGLSYGSQRWPDTLQISPNNQTIATPYVSESYANAGNPMNSEVKEFFRSGSPKWLWDFALPQAYTMLFTAWYNTGKMPTWLNGFAVGFAGHGEGKWFRVGPSFYPHGRTMNTGIGDVYLLRPNPLMRDRFVQQGESTLLLFDKGKAQEGSRGWVQTVDLHSGTADYNDSISGDSFTQHLIALGDCAEFVPGTKGDACYAKLLELMAEIASDNLVDHVPCNGDSPPTTQCTVGSFFVYLYRYALFVWRFAGTFATDDALVHREAVVGLSKLLLEKFIPKQASDPDIEGSWSYFAACDLASGMITSCNVKFGDPWQIFPDEKPAVLALPLIARQLADYTPDPCAYVKLIAANDKLYTEWLETYSSYYGGWVEGNSYFMQSMIFAVGGLDECEN